MKEYEFKTIKIDINNKKFLLNIEYIYNRPGDKSIIITEVIETSNNDYYQLDSYIDYVFGEDYNNIQKILIDKAMLRILEYCEIIK